VGERPKCELFKWHLELHLRYEKPGKCEWLETNDPAVLAHTCSTEGSCVFAIHNLGGREVEVNIDLGRENAGGFDLLRNCEYPAGKGRKPQFRLRPYGYLWLRERHGPEFAVAGDNLSCS
jgi:Maltogenic Amylase, C-terminal domain